MGLRSLLLQCARIKYDDAGYTTLLIPMEMYSTAKGNYLISETQIFSQAVNQWFVQSLSPYRLSDRQTETDNHTDRRTDKRQAESPTDVPP